MPTGVGDQKKENYVYLLIECPHKSLIFGNEKIRNKEIGKCTKFRFVNNAKYPTALYTRFNIFEIFIFQK